MCSHWRWNSHWHEVLTHASIERTDGRKDPTEGQSRSNYTFGRPIDGTAKGLPMTGTRFMRRQTPKPKAMSTVLSKIWTKTVDVNINSLIQSIYQFIHSSIHQLIHSPINLFPPFTRSSRVILCMLPFPDNYSEPLTSSAERNRLQVYVVLIWRNC